MDKRMLTFGYEGNVNLWLWKSFAPEMKLAFNVNNVFIFSQKYKSTHNVLRYAAHTQLYRQTDRITLVINKTGCIS